MNYEFTKGFEKKGINLSLLQLSHQRLLKIGKPSLCKEIIKNGWESSAGWILSDVLNEFVKNLLGDE